MKTNQLAVLDLGTNTFHLLILRKEPDGTVTELHKEKRFVRLGKGGISRGVIAQDAYQRAFDTLADYMRIIQQHGEARVIRATATSALRSASNGPQFVAEVEEKIGFRLEIIEGDEEAELIFEGVTSEVPLGTEKALVVDIGGGSVEFIIGDRLGILWKQSFEIGAQRMYDQFHTEDPIAKESISRLEAHASHLLQPLKDALESYRPTRFIGSSGTFSSLWAMHLAKVVTYHGTSRKINRMEFQQLLKPLLSLNVEERLKIPGMVPERVEMITVAACLVSLVFDWLATDSIEFSGSALKEGVAKRLLSTMD